MIALVSLSAMLYRMSRSDHHTSSERLAMSLCDPCQCNRLLAIAGRLQHKPMPAVMQRALCLQEPGQSRQLTAAQLAATPLRDFGPDKGFPTPQAGRLPGAVSSITTCL